MEQVACPRCRREFVDWDDYIEHMQAHDAIDEAPHWKFGDYPDPWSGG